MMYSAYKLNKHDDNIQPWRTPFPIWNQSVVPCPVPTVASWPAYRFLKRKVRWSGIPISFRIFQFVVIHIVKGYYCQIKTPCLLCVQIPYCYSVMEPPHKIKSSSLHHGLIQSNLWSTHVLDTMTHNTTSCPFFLNAMILLSSLESTLFSGQLSFFVLHEALPDYCSGTLLCQLSHSAHHTIYFNMGWHIFSDWSLSFSFIFSTTQLTM